MPTNKGSFKLFRAFGIDVYIHWAWFLAFWYLASRPNQYSNYGWNAVEILSLFLIVLVHEFGHQLACRQVGGKTHDIVLWPLGGVAYVTPPQRPGAQLWSIAAGPLVNVLLIPVLAALWSASFHLGWPQSHPNAYQLMGNIWAINFLILIFNLMPVYPLDGGQILRSLLWFIFGRANSLFIAATIGLIVTAGFAAWLVRAYFQPNPNRERLVYYGIMAAFVVMNCWDGLKQAGALARIAKLPRRDGFACPSCKAAPSLGELWRCGSCGKPFDTFITQAACPHCGKQFNATQCLECGTASPLDAWKLPTD
ncbi:MAG: site-2 protease family protein [Limisphaerales bacterium]